MKKELENKLYKKYPKLFKQKDLPMTQTCMCWGIMHDSGWYWLLDNVCSYLDYYNKDNGTDIEFVEIKEKYGTERLYLNGGTPEVYEVISFAEQLSGSICEVCGIMEGIKLRDKQGWYKTLCEKHNKDYQKGINFNEVQLEKAKALKKK